MMTRYEVEVTAVGEEVTGFVEAGVLVLFGEDVPDELRPFSVVHQGGILRSNVRPGDEVRLGDTPYRVTAVGAVANANLTNLGHLVLKCSGAPAAELPGDVVVEAKPLVMVEPGTIIRISGPA